MSGATQAEFDCMIVGAGIVGAACALACTQAGLHTAVVERAGAGAEATAAAMGHVVLMSDSPAQFALTRRSQQLWESVRTQLPPEAEYRQIGTLWIAANQAEMAEVERRDAWYAAQGVPSGVLGATALANAEPNLRQPLAGALSMPGDSVLAPKIVAAWMLEQAQSSGASLVHGEATAAGNGLLSLRDGRELRGRAIVLATGTDAAKLVPGLPLRRRKGQLMLTKSYPGYLRHQVAEMGYITSAHAEDTESVAFNVQPRANGQLLVGSSRQYGVDDPRVEPHILEAILARAVEFLPGVRSLSMERSWTGFRAATPDKLPLIGPAGPFAGDDPTLYLATGHEGLGITTSLTTAELLINQLVGRTGAIPHEPYLPARLAPRPALPPGLPQAAYAQERR